MAIVGATIALAKLLGLAVIAEGIEDAETADLLARKGCKEGQGYHFGRPMPVADLDRKSTRLNSSHQIISYAVFCLKKKKNRTPVDGQGTPETAGASQIIIIAKPNAIHDRELLISPGPSDEPALHHPAHSLGTLEGD